MVVFFQLSCRAGNVSGYYKADRESFLWDQFVGGVLVSDPVGICLAGFAVGAVSSGPGRQLAVPGADLPECAVGCVLLVRVCVCETPYAGAPAQPAGCVRFAASGCGCGGFDRDFYAAAVCSRGRAGSFLCSAFVYLWNCACGLDGYAEKNAAGAGQAEYEYVAAAFVFDLLFL